MIFIKQMLLLWKKDGKTGIINSKGKQLLPIEYDKISYAWY